MMWHNQTKIINCTFTGAILVLLLGSYLIVFSPYIQRLGHLRSQASDLQQQLEFSAQLHTGLNHIQAEVAALEQRLAGFGQHLPQEAQLDNFLRQIDQAIKQTSFKVTMIKPGTWEHKALYSQLPITITAESRFPEFYDFLSALYEIPRLTKVDTLTIVRKDGSDVCDIALTLLIYMAKVTNES
jgi:Tfp pilus assembly protein PilO